MVDSAQVQKIVRLAGVKPNDNMGDNAGECVLEVGPGLGSLTLGLLEAGAKVIAVEIDKKLATLLPETVAQLAPKYTENLSVMQEDALKLTPALLKKHLAEHISKNKAFAKFTPKKLVSNLPYNVATPILITLLERFPEIDEVLVLVQAEIAERLVAEAGSKIYGIPSAKLAFFGSASIAGVVPRSAFWPVPRVDSKLVRFGRGGNALASRVSNSEKDSIFALINLAFSQRRKTLRSLLVQNGHDGDKVTQILDSLQIDPFARGETLTVTQFAEIAQRL